jgi:hypothetical protein
MNNQEEKTIELGGNNLAFLPKDQKDLKEASYWKKFF